MRTLIYIILLFASCQKTQQVEPVIMPDLLKYNLNTDAAQMFLKPDFAYATDTFFYFQNHLYTMTITPTHYGTRTEIVCAGSYTLNASALNVQWKAGPLKGVREILEPVAVENGFTKLRSRCREFWLKN